MINKHFFNFLIEFALFVQILLWAILGATIIVPILYWWLSQPSNSVDYFNIKDYLKKFRNYKIKE